MALAGGGTCRRTRRAVDAEDARCYSRCYSLKLCQQWLAGGARRRYSPVRRLLNTMACAWRWQNSGNLMAMLCALPYGRSAARQQGVPAAQGVGAAGPGSKASGENRETREAVRRERIETWEQGVGQQKKWSGEPKRGALSMTMPWYL
jgi:hypothetical protein